MNKILTTIHRIPKTTHRISKIIHRIPTAIHRIPKTLPRIPTTIHRIPKTIHTIPKIIIDSHYKVLEIERVAKWLGLVLPLQLQVLKFVPIQNLPVNSCEYWHQPMGSKSVQGRTGHPATCYVCSSTDILLEGREL